MKYNNKQQSDPNSKYLVQNINQAKYVYYNFDMQDQSIRPSLVKSSFFRRRQNELYNYLIKDMAMDEDLAHLLLKVHKPNNITETLNLFLTDQNGTINHAFIPKDGLEDICRVCQEPPHNHKEYDSQKLNQQIRKNDEVQRSSMSSVSQQQDNQPRYTCEICYIQVIKSDTLQIKEEVHNICLQCMDGYIKEQVSNMRVQQLACPHCEEALPPNLIQDLTDSSTFAKYNLFIRNLQIQKNPNLKWCPNPKCSVVVSTNSKKKTSKCPKCATEICNKCNREAHPKQSCDGAFKKQIQNWQNASDIQKCKKCQGLVQKIAGCNHMTCSICLYQWCWLCGSDYSTIHFNTLNPFGCPGLQNRLRDDWGGCKILLLRIGILLLLLVAAPVAIPIAMVVCGPILVGHFFWNCIYPQRCLQKFLIILLSIIIGIPASPFIWVGSIFYFIPLGIIKLYQWCKNRRYNEQRRINFLKQRLIGEQVYQQNSNE